MKKFICSSVTHAHPLFWYELLQLYDDGTNLSLLLQINGSGVIENGVGYCGEQHDGEHMLNSIPALPIKPSNVSELL